MADESISDAMKTTTISEEPLVQIRLINEGRPHTYSPKLSYGRKTINIGRVWQVLYNGEVIGGVRHEMLTRERRIPGRMYVASRWQSPGWQRTHKDPAENWYAFHRALEASSRKSAIESIVWDHEWSIRDSARKTEPTETGPNKESNA